VPVAHFYLTACTEEQERRLLEDGSARYAAILESPLERVRIFVHHHPPASTAVGGRVVADTGQHAPYFSALMLRGRPVEQRHQLLNELTELLAEILCADRSLIRGLITEVDPDGWGIGGVPASVLRADEIAARAADRAGRGAAHVPPA
jgi:4-oxalocrotonate tautomerase family enzyme